MDAVSPEQSASRPPWLESWAARAGVAVLVALSALVGFRHWKAQGEEDLAYLTVGAELIAFAGLALAWHHGWRRWGRAGGALLVTALAAAWCGMTMFQKIEADTRTQAIAEARERPAYVFAANAARTATTLLEDRLRHPEARPLCTCPDTIRAWEASEAAAIDRLRSERNVAVEQMEAAIPPHRTDWIAIVRGLGIEVSKLLGFAVFGLAISPAPKQSHVPSHDKTPSHWWMRLMRRMRLPGLIGATSLAAAPAQAAQAPEITGVSPVLLTDAIVRLPETSKKAQAFAMRGRLRPDEIAETVGVSRATVYRWFRERDRDVAKAAA